VRAAAAHAELYGGRRGGANRMGRYDRSMERDVGSALEARRQELAQDLARLTAPPEAGTNLSFGKRIGEGTTLAVERINTTAAARSIAATLASVERALEKVADGTYGFCDNCGQAIAPERLEAIPGTVFCVTCSALGLTVTR